MTELSPQSQDHQHKDIGRDTFVLSANGTPIRFRPTEKLFLIALDETHNIEIAAERAGKDLDWAKNFFKRPKIQEWMSLVAKQQSAITGMTIGWLRSEMASVYYGFKVWWEGDCELCHVKQKSWIEPEDDGTFPCLACQHPVKMSEQKEIVKKDRQQMVALQELSSRIDPKVERISHEFSAETFNFTAQGD